MITFKEKYLKIYSDFKRKGSKNKILMLIFLLIGLLYSFSVVEVKYYRYHWYNTLPHKNLILIFIGITIVWIFVVLMMNSILFINKQKIRSFEYKYKHDFIHKLQLNESVIKDYLHNQKIHPKVFYDSGLFHKKYTDYIGDDWIKGEYHGIQFEICELNVFNLFTNIFHGFFIVIKSDLKNYDNNINTEFVDKFEKDFCARIKASNNNHKVYLAIEFRNNFLKCDKENHINKVEFDYKLIYSTIQIVKNMIDNNN